MHEVVFEKDGKMMMKNIPTGSLFKPIRLKIGREIGRNRGETDNLTSFLSLTVIINWNQGELGQAGPQNLNDAILGPARELDACTDDSDSDVE